MIVSGPKIGGRSSLFFVESSDEGGKMSPAEEEGGVVVDMGNGSPRLDPGLKGERGTMVFQSKGGVEQEASTSREEESSSQGRS